MRKILKNPFFLALAVSGAIATSFTLLVIVYTDAGTALFFWAIILLCTLFPTGAIALVAWGLMRENARLTAEQAVEPREVLRKHYKDQMVVSILAPTIEGMVVATYLYLIGKASVERILLMFSMLFIVFSFYFLQGFLGWWRNR